MGQLVFGTLGASIGQALLPGGLSAFGLSVSGQALGGLAGATIGNAVNRAVFGTPSIDGPRLETLPVQGSTEGAPIPLLYGRSRLAGQVIWASRYTEKSSASGGGKGGPRVTNYAYSVSFAVGLCEGRIDGIGRIWANGELLDQSGLDVRVYKGSEDQPPDPLIETIEGPQNTPAFRGLAYLVFEDLPLDNFGNRIPNLSFEVFRSPQGAFGENRLENKIRGVDLIPASGEFAYSTTPVRDSLGPGRQRQLNINNSRGKTDFEAAIDDLESSLPNCKAVLIVSAWFGNDLRCGECETRPGTETRDKVTTPYVWTVAGEDRSTALLVTQAEGRPVYGGTPSDRSLIEAIQALKSRGYSVSLYPFILMDVPAGNGLPDPYGGSEQAIFPWRGRITCHPASGQTGTVDGSQAAADQVDAFFGSAIASDFTITGEQVSYTGPAEWRFRRFVLHNAAIASAAGGVDAFLIGTELRGLTTVRGEADSFPAVDQLCELATEVRAITGPQTKLSYAADWSEYFGYQPADGSGNVYFHLDPLWSHPEIDAVAIDWYAPLSDWRDDSNHLDSGLSRSIYDLEYLSGNVEGGEGYEWYYASDAERESQSRSQISDGAYAKPWVFRYKDIRNWWSNPHFDRRSGVELATASPWVPEAKPVWFTELGCPAIDKGSNQPNVFIDPKSSESFAPHYSSGARDDLIQRRYIEAHLDYWSAAAANNPISAVYGGPMIDPDQIHIWTWDARPFPDFPVRQEVWSDGENWRLGHWLNGRIGMSPLGLVLRDIAEQAGLELETAGIEGIVTGYVIDRPMPARDALSPLMTAFGFTLADRDSGAVALHPDADVSTSLSPEDLAILAQGEAFTALESDPDQLPRDVRLTFQLDTADYRVSSLYARRETADLDAVHDVQLPLLADEATASRWAEDLLQAAHWPYPEFRFQLPPSRLAIEVGDCVGLDGHTLMIGARTGQAVSDIEAAPFWPRTYTISGSIPDNAGDTISAPADPAVLLVDIPLQLTESVDRNGPIVAVYADPWPGDVTLLAGETSETLAERRIATQPATIGTANAGASELPKGRWVEWASIDVVLAGGELLSRTKREVLDGGNVLAIESTSGWFTIQFQNAELIAPQTYRLSGLLAMQPTLFSDLPGVSNCVLLDAATGPLPLPANEHSIDLVIGAIAGGQSSAETFQPFRYERRDLEPLSPVHLKVRRYPGGWHFSWIRRSRIGGDDWVSADIPLDDVAERYLVEFLVDDLGIYSYEVTSPSLDLTESEFEAVFGHPQPDFVITVRQVSARFGPGQAARREVAAG